MKIIHTHKHTPICIHKPINSLRGTINDVVSYVLLRFVFCVRSYVQIYTKVKLDNEGITLLWNMN